MGMMIPGRSCRPRGLCDGSPSARRGLESTCRDSASMMIGEKGVEESACEGYEKPDEAEEEKADEEQE